MSEPQKPYRMTIKNAATGEITSVTEYPENAPILPALTANERGADRGTPSARWKQDGQPDPHGNRYECERSDLIMGQHTDDELANSLFLCNHRASLDSIGLLTAAKDRILWLSRALEAERTKHAAEIAAAVQEGRDLAEADMAMSVDERIAAAVLAEREALLRDIPATDGLMPDEVGGFLKGLLAYQLAIRARGTTDAVERVEAGVREKDRERLLSSKLDFHEDEIEQLAFELAFELEEAELSPKDYVTVNREKLRAIASRVLHRRGG